MGYGGNNIAYSNAGGVIGVTDTNTSVPTLNYFNGQIDELRIYNRILSDAEIALLSNPNCSLIHAVSNYVFTVDTTLKASQKIELTGVEILPSATVTLIAPEVQINGDSSFEDQSQLSVINENECDIN